MAADFLGRGWAFPVDASAGDVNMVAGADDIRQAIRLILETEPGERVMRTEFGAGLASLVFEPITSRLLALVRNQVETALIRWEPRIDIDGVNVSADQAAGGVLRIEIAYRVRATNTFYNLVYPFYLKERSA